LALTEISDYQVMMTKAVEASIDNWQDAQ